MAGKRIILFLGLILLVVAVLSVLLPRLKTSQREGISLSEASQVKEDPTGTFVDTLLGDFVYFKDNAFYLVSLPSRRSTQLAGVTENIVSAFPKVRPAWSYDGEKFAVVSDENSAVVVKFSSGELVKKIVLDPPLNFTKKIEIGFSPDGLYLFLRQDLDNSRKSLRFFALSSGELVSEQSDCTGPGAWVIKRNIYVTTCQKTIIAIDPAQSRAVIPISPDASLTFINVFDSQSLLVKRSGKPGKLSLEGKFTSLDTKVLGGTGLDAFADLPRALADKITELKKTEPIDDLIVSPNNTFALFHTQKGLWIIDLPLKSDPFFLFPGELPSVRPL